MSYKGYYINLDRSTDRRNAMEAELGRVNLKQKYKRLRAADGNEEKIVSPLENQAEIGCFLSHVWAVREGLTGGQPIHIVEDDVIFAPGTDRTLETMLLNGAFDAYDIVFTDIAVPLTNEAYLKYKTMFDKAVTRDENGAVKNVKYQTIDLRDVLLLAASSYLVNKAALQKLRRIYDDEMAAGIRMPIDTFLGSLAKAGTLKIGCLFPFLTSIKPIDTVNSTIRENTDPSRKFTAANIGRYTFFAGCDFNECDLLINEQIAQPPETDRHAQVLTKLLAYSLLDNPQPPMQ